MDVGLANQELIRKVSYAIQDNSPDDNRGGFAPVGQQDNNQTERRDIDLRGVNLTPEQQRQIQLQIPKFKRRPTIIFSDDLGTMSITGDPEDVNNLADFINDLIRLAPQLDRRTTEIVPLNYSDPTTLQTELNAIYEAQYSQYGPITISAISHES